MSKDELQAELEERELAKSGNKDDLVARLELDDAERAGDGPPDEAGDPDAEVEPADADDADDEAGDDADDEGEGSDDLAGALAASLTTVSPPDLREDESQLPEVEEPDEDAAAPGTGTASPADLRAPRSGNIGVDDDVAKRYAESIKGVEQPASFSNLPATHHASNQDESTRYRLMPDGTKVPISVSGGGDVPEEEGEGS